ncbi:hypothetical protein CR513_59257, partial [Mucuna pruriens]
MKPYKINMVILLLACPCTLLSRLAHPYVSRVTQHARAMSSTPLLVGVDHHAFHFCNFLVNDVRCFVFISRHGDHRGPFTVLYK